MHSVAPRHDKLLCYKIVEYGKTDVHVPGPNTGSKLRHANYWSRSRAIPQDMNELVQYRCRKRSRIRKFLFTEEALMLSSCISLVYVRSLTEELQDVWC